MTLTLSMPPSPVQLLAHCSHRQEGINIQINLKEESQSWVKRRTHMSTKHQQLCGERIKPRQANDFPPQVDFLRTVATV